MGAARLGEPGSWGGGQRDAELPPQGSEGGGSLSWEQMRRMLPRLEGKGEGVTVGRAGLGEEIQKVKETQGAVAASHGGTVQGRLEELGSLTGSVQGGWRRRAQPGLEGRVVPAVIEGRGGQGDQGQGPATGSVSSLGYRPWLIGPRHKAPGSTPPHRGPSPGRWGFGGDSPCWAGRLGQTERWKRSSVRRRPPDGILTGCCPGASRAGVGRCLPMISPNFSLSPPVLHLSASPLLALK